MSGAHYRDRVPTDVHLHIGLPKTGTSYVQDGLWASRERLAAQGVLVPGERRVSTNQAVWDLLGRRPRGAEHPRLAGAFRSLVAEVTGWSGRSVVLSEELLSAATPRQVGRVVRALGPARVHVVVTVRDLGRVLVGAWQQELAKGRAWTWQEYAAAVRDPDQGPASASLLFWLRQDVSRVLDTWETAVPRDRVRLVTVPPAGAPPELLLRRFAGATGVDPTALRSGPAGANVSVGAAEAEVLRRLNASLGDRLNERQYSHVVAHRLRPALQARRGARPLWLPEADQGWVADRSAATVDQLRARGNEVVGDLADLLPAVAAAERGRPDEATEGEVAAAALAALSAVVESHGRLWWRTRGRADGAEDAAPRRGGLSAATRTAAYRAKLAALALGDRSRLARRLLTRYARRA